MPDHRPTAWFDDVARIAAIGPTHFVLAVCSDLNERESLTDWLLTAVAAFGSAIETIEPDDLVEYLDTAKRTERRIILLIPGATDGNSAQLADRWGKWNASRDRFRNAASFSNRAVIFIATAARMSEVSQHALDLLSVTPILTVQSEPIPVDDNRELSIVYHQVLRDMEKQYSMTTPDFVARLFHRDPIPVSREDLHRWRSAAEALGIEPSG